MLRAPRFAHRRRVDERADTFFRPRATTNKAAAPARNRSERSEPSDRANRAPEGRRSDERRRVSSATSEGDVGSTARDARAVSIKGRWVLTSLLILVCLVAGCSYDRQEPGLFGQPVTQDTTAPPIHRAAPEERQVQNPELPVVGEAIWTSADGLGITVRIAVHAVRRFPGGTVLDWSVTPLHGPGLRPSDPVPSRLDLGLSRPNESYPNIVLMDAARSRIYRPLTLRGSDSSCLCTRLFPNSLRIGYTSLSQIAFPALPDDVATVDVYLATVPPFWRVPVTPHGMLPLASSPTDLSRGPEVTSVVASTKVFRYPVADQSYLVMINAVYASSSFTSIVWAIRAVEPGLGLRTASTPPLADAQSPPQAYNQAWAGGPQIRLGTSPALTRARLVTSKLAGEGALECLCTDLRIGAFSLRQVGAQMSVVTTLPPLPSGTSRVDIVFPDLTTLADVAVTPAPDSTFRSAGPAVREVRFWTYRPYQQHPGWGPRDWPTPLPRSYQLRDFQATVDTIVR
jgi:hypothetical protein